MEDNERRPRLFRHQPTRNEAGNIVVFLIALALVCAIALVLFVGLGAILPAP